MAIVVSVEGEKMSRCEAWVGAACGEQCGSDDVVPRIRLRN